MNGWLQTQLSFSTSSTPMNYWILNRNNPFQRSLRTKIILCFLQNLEVSLICTLESILCKQIKAFSHGLIKRLTKDSSLTVLKNKLWILSLITIITIASLSWENPMPDFKSKESSENLTICFPTSVGYLELLPSPLESSWSITASVLFNLKCAKKSLIIKAKNKSNIK